MSILLLLLALENRKIYIYCASACEFRGSKEMVLAFVLPLLTALISGYIYKKSTDEIGYLAAGVSIISFVTSLVLAPWEVQVLLLVVVLASTQKLLQHNDYKINLQGSDNHKIEDRRIKE
jgi:hypothetical protein